MGRTKRLQRNTFTPRQSDVIREVMLSAGECETWLTLEELAKLTKYPPASISAQLRHLRKPRHGSFVVEKRRREADEVARQVLGGPVWEYRLRRGFVLPGNIAAAVQRLLAR